MMVCIATLIVNIAAQRETTCPKFVLCTCTSEDNMIVNALSQHKSHRKRHALVLLARLQTIQQ
jgi:hypothetical protein